MKILLLALGLGSATEAPKEDFALETVVRSSRRDETLEDVPFAVTVLKSDDIADGRPAQSLGEALNQVPGVLASSEFNANQDLRISVRGFGARAPFGVRGIKVILDGIPLTVADGSSVLDVIDPALIRRVEILRGPAAALYGSAASAVILIETVRAETSPPLSIRSALGEPGLVRGSFAYTGRSNASNWSLAASGMRWIGEREQSTSETQTVVSRLETQVGERGRLTLTALGHNGPRAQDPGALTAEEVRLDRRQAAPNSLRFRTGEQVRQGQVGLNYRHQGQVFFSELQAHGWSRQFRARIPFNAIELERWIASGRATVGIDTSSFRLETGAELDIQRDRRRNFDNDEGGIGPQARLRQEENVTSKSWNVQAEWRGFDKKLRIRTAGRIDAYRFELADRLLSDGDESGVREFRAATALVGLVFRPIRGVDIFANSSLAYDVPTVGELSEFVGDSGAPIPGLNPSLSESRIASFELGARGRLSFVKYEAVVFFAKSDNEIVSFEIAPDVDVFRNTGLSERAGAEAQVSVQQGGFDVVAQASTLWSRLDDLGDDGLSPLANSSRTDERRLRVPGAADWLAYGQVRYRANNGWFAAYELRGRGPVELGPRLSERAWVSHVRGGLSTETPTGSMTVSVGVRNVWDQAYIDNFRPNSFGGRFFEPAPGRWFFGQFELTFDEVN